MIDNHYQKPRLWEFIQESIQQAEIDIHSLSREDIKFLDEFHLQGANISEQLAKLLQLDSSSHVLDVGCGIGGPCRMLADVYQCNVVGIDCTEEYIKIANELSKWVGLSDKTTFVHGDALKLPFEDHSFDIVWTQHAQMNIEDKAQFYSEIKRVLTKDGQFVYYDIFQGKVEDMYFPVPWAEIPENNHLIPHEVVLSFFNPVAWDYWLLEDHTRSSLDFLSQVITRAEKGESPSLGLNLLMQESTNVKFKNLHRCLVESLVEVHAGILKRK